MTKPCPYFHYMIANFSWTVCLCFNAMVFYTICCWLLLFEMVHMSASERVKKPIEINLQNYNCQINAKRAMISKCFSSKLWLQISLRKYVTFFMPLHRNSARSFLPTLSDTLNKLPCIEKEFFNHVVESGYSRMKKSDILPQKDL